MSNAYGSWGEYLRDLDEASRDFSERLNDLIFKETVAWCRFDGSRNELTIRFHSGRTLFVDNIKDVQDISVN